VKVDINTVNEYTRELSIDVPWEELESNFDSTIKNFSKKIKMPGFRSGKIPKDRLLKQFQPNIEEEFMESNFQEFYVKALRQSELVPVNKQKLVMCIFI